MSSLKSTFFHILANCNLLYIFFHINVFFLKTQIIFLGRLKPQPPRDPCVPNPCGRNAIARGQGNRCICECERGFFGDPFTGCRRECEYNRDCATTLACENYKCVDPCQRGLCGINAECSVQNHNAICQCIPGHFGDPFTRCSKLLLGCMLLF